MNFNTLSILLIDDSRGDYILTRELLAEVKEAKYHLDWVSTYDKGLDAIKLNSHDIYLLDHNLGENRTGLDLLNEAINNGCKAPIILLTGFGDHDLDIDAMKSGAAFFLDKSTIQSEALERVIRYALEQKRAEEEKLLQAYFYDKITGLANIYLFKEHLTRAIALAERYSRELAIICFDIDNFRRINDSLNHACGDKLLKDVGDRLSSLIRKSDILGFDMLAAEPIKIARIGNDEFMILLSEIKGEYAAKVARRILDSLDEPFYLDKQEVFITACIGITVYPNDGNSVSTLLKNADRALRHAQQIGKNQYQFYEKSMNSASLKRLLLENLLHKALKKGELTLHYQPQVNVRDKTLIGFEVLLRWIHPEMGNIPPNEFITIAEECGLIIPIGEWIVKSACSQMTSWIKEGYNPVRISINLSKYQFNQVSLLEYIHSILKQVNLSPEYLEFEITETAVMHNETKTITMLHKLKAMGVRLSMDDFGTGYSSLSYLRQFPLDALKIDRSFIEDIPGDQDDYAIVRAIIALAQSLNLSVIAEGVETEEQLKALLAMDCKLVQGFLFSKPLPPDEAKVYLTHKQTNIAQQDIFDILSGPFIKQLGWK